MAARHKPAGSTQAERDAISLGRIESLIDSMVHGSILCPSCAESHKIKMLDQSVVTAMRMRYDKLRPTLSATELTSIDPADKLSESDLLAQLSALIEQHPDLVQQALAAKARKDAASLGATMGATTDAPIAKHA